MRYQLVREKTGCSTDGTPRLFIEKNRPNVGADNARRDGVVPMGEQTKIANIIYILDHSVYTLSTAIPR